jgi:hypothetical protein
MNQVRRGERQVSSERAGKNVKRKITALILCAMLFALCASAAAQQPVKPPKIGFLSSGYGEGSSGWRGSFVREFGKLGYVEGKT